MKKILPLALLLIFAVGCKPKVQVEIAQQQENKPGYMQKDALMVQGVSKVSITPDRVDLTFGMFQETKQLKDATSKTKEIMNNVLTYAAKAGIPQSDIKVQNLSMNKFTRNIYKYDEKGRKIFDRAESYYRVDQTFTLTLTDITQYAKVLNDILDLGVNKITNINFYSTKMDETKEKAMVQAIESAKNKADIITKTSGLKINKLINVVEFDGDRSRYVTAPTIMRGDNPSYTPLAATASTMMAYGDVAEYRNAAQYDKEETSSVETIVPVTPAGTIDVYGTATLIYELK